MTEPIFVLSPPRSGGSIVAGLLCVAGGATVVDPIPATIEQPHGSFEPRQIVEAHRDLLAQFERDATCPPIGCAFENTDLRSLERGAASHATRPTTTVVKDPALMFLLGAWPLAGLKQARLVAVARPPFDAIRSIAYHDRICEDQAELIIERYLARLSLIAETVPLPLVRFAGDQQGLLDEVRNLAGSLGLGWDQVAAESFVDAELIRHSSPHEEDTPEFLRLLKHACRADEGPVQSVDLLSLAHSTDPTTRIASHLGDRYAAQRNELWAAASFRSRQMPETVELVLTGAQRPVGPPLRAGARSVRVLEVASPLGVGAALFDSGVRPEAVAVQGLIGDRPQEQVDALLATLYAGTKPAAEVILDVPDPDSPLQSHFPEELRRSRVNDVMTSATAAGWSIRDRIRISPGRSAISLAKQLTADSTVEAVRVDLEEVLREKIALTEELRELAQRVESLEEEVANGLSRRQRAERSGRGHRRRAERAERDAGEQRRRAERAESDLQRLRRRRMVRIALWLGDRSRPLVRRYRAIRRRAER